MVSRQILGLAVFGALVSMSLPPGILRASGDDAAAADAAKDREWANLEAPEHDYWNRALKDRFTELKGRLEAGVVTLDPSGELPYLLSLLKELEIPVSSQLLVFSTTSLQLRFISPQNPRAIYFNEDIYVGYIPGGRMEIVSLDPEVGGIYYIFDIPKGMEAPVVDRADRCMNCHADEDTNYVPGIAIKSVIPGLRGGSLNAFRQKVTGHGIPFEERFGGWHVTGDHAIGKHMGNLLGEMNAGTIRTEELKPGAAFDFSKYPVPTSDILAHLLFEHQAGFVNRFVEASYRTRTYLHEDTGLLSAEHTQELNGLARELTKYLLFADEVALPGAGVTGDSAYVEEFLANRREASNGMSLKDLDLKKRIFKYRCSYMIYSPVFAGMPGELKKKVYRGLQQALNTEEPIPEFGHLAPSEKLAIRGILRETLKDLPAGW